MWKHWGTYPAPLVLLLCACGTDDRVGDSPTLPSGSELKSGDAGSAQQQPAPADAGAGLTWPPPLRHRLSMGLQSGCVLSHGDDHLVCWGDPLPGDPPFVVPSGRFTHVSSNVGTMCGLRDVGTIACWGNTDGGSQIPPGGMFSFMAVGVSVSCGIDAAGAVSCWGVNSDQSLPATDSYRAVGVGRRFGCGLTVAGALRCSGGIQTAPSDGPYVMLAVGKGHACALREDRSLACWGTGGPGQPTDGTDPEHVSFGQAIPPAGEFVYVAAGSQHSCALRPDGRAVCWGAGKTQGDCQNDLDACGMALPPDEPFVELALGATNSCGLRADNSVRCWGSNTGNRSTPPEGPL